MTTERFKPSPHINNNGFIMMSKAVIMSGLLLFSIISSAQVKLPQLVRDSMVLQRETKVKVWGWASKGEKVTVSFKGKQFKTTTGPDGRWSVLLPPMKAGGPYTMNISGSNK